MDPARWQQVVAIFEAALAVPEAERGALLADRCGADAALREEVERLLAGDRASGPLDRPAAELLDALAADAGEAGAAPAAAAEPPGARDDERNPIARDDATAAASREPLPARIGRYEIRRRIGRGGFGEVFSGFDPVLKRAVAIKTCPATSAEARLRFEREAEIAARLTHPNITTVHDFGEADGVPYLVQELLDGEDLAQRLARPPALGLAEKLAILLQVARGLAHAHAEGVTHRDVKPGNLRLLSGGRVKIMDFGIARQAESATTSLTQAGAALGTIAYMAPEQIRGESTDRRVDVYAFGVVAYELLAGRRPFAAASGPTLLYQVLHTTPPPLAAVWPAAPPALAALLERCLDKDPGRRYVAFPSLLADLEAVAAAVDPALAASEVASGGATGPSGESGVSPWPGSSSWAGDGQGRARRAGLVAVLLLAALGVAGWWAWRRSSERPIPPAPAGPTPAVASAPPATGRLAIDAHPWARIEAVVAADGTRPSLPVERTTPLALALPPGEYTVTLQPARGEARTCRATVRAGSAATCEVRFARLSAAEFLARVGAEETAR